MKKNDSNVALFKRISKKLGLTFKMESMPGNKTLFSITDGTRMYLGSTAEPGFFPNVQRWNATLTKNKHLTQRILNRLKYKTIRSVYLFPKDFSSCGKFMSFAEQKAPKYPFIVKPDVGLQGAGIKYITDKKTLRDAIRPLYEKSKVSMLQPIIDQEEYRVLVINNKVELVHSKGYYSVIGDGEQTIESLLKNVPKNKQDEKFQLEVYKKLKKTKKTILEKDEKFPCHLIKKPTTDYYASEKLPKHLVKWSIDLAKQLSSPVLGIDIFVKSDLNNPKDYTIIELNSNPGLGYFYSWYDDDYEPERICESVLRNYFKMTAK